MNNRTFRINSVLPILLFCAFALFALWVASTSVRTYRQEQAAAQENETGRMISAYIDQKIRQADPGTVSIGTFGGRQALVIAQSDGSWTTYVYRCGSRMMEQAVQRGASADPAGGTEIAEVTTFQLKMVKPNLLQVRFTPLGGRVKTAYMTVNSGL